MVTVVMLNNYIWHSQLLEVLECMKANKYVLIMYFKYNIKYKFRSS